MARNTAQSPQNLLVRFPGELAAAYRAEGFWADETVHDVAAGWRIRAPGTVAVRESHSALTYGELVELADRIAAEFAALGLKPGARVAAWLSSRLEMAAVLLACARGSYVLCPSLHRNHTPEEVAELLGKMQARVLLAEEGFGAGGDGDSITERTRGVASLVKVYRLPPPRARTLDDMIAMLGLGEHGLAAPAGRADDVVYLAFTSGTTGRPKGVMHSNNTLLANARSLGRDWEFDADSVIYTLSPLSHNLGFGALVLAIRSGCTIVLHDLAKGQSLLDRLRETATTFVFGVPAHALDLLAELEARGGVALERLRGFRISGAAVPTSVAERLLGHGVVPQSGYGMTEAGSHNYTMPADDPETIVTTSGRACAGYELAIFATDDRERMLGVGETGEIGGRGASLMLGYFGNQPATEASFNSAGWFMTGDLGRLDARGYLHVTGRIKDVIIRGGHNIYPTKIEMLAMRHPHVERAAAIAVRDERLGERVCIVVMSKNKELIDAGELLSHLHAEGLSKYDMPEYFAQVDEIPLSASGKILKRALLPDVHLGRLRPVPVRWRPAASERSEA